MNTDHDYQIGKSHLVCQDYALSGILESDNLRGAYAIVCDGCSSSQDVDIGARLLALAAREVLAESYHNKCLELTAEGGLNTWDLGAQAISGAWETASKFTLLSSQTLDATLLAAWVANGRVEGRLYGDGCLLHRRGTGVQVMRTHYASVAEGKGGAPDFLSYHLDHSRRDVYLAAQVPKKVTCMVAEDKLASDSAPTALLKSFEPIAYSCAVEPGDVIVLISDGLESFRRSDDSAIPWHEMVNEILDFKTFNGVFVRRRLAALKRQCQKSLITHSDDISVAAVRV